MQPTDLQSTLSQPRRPVLDGFVHHAPAETGKKLPNLSGTKRSTPRSVASERPFQRPTARHVRKNRWERLQTPLLFLGCMLGGFFVQSLWFGLLAVLAYGVFATWGHINSHVTFLLACISLITTIVILLVRQNVALASNFATYTFLLLVLGVIALTIEARPQKRRRRRTGR